jgi:hypothetical protein
MAKDPLTSEFMATGDIAVAGGVNYLVELAFICLKLFERGISL